MFSGRAVVWRERSLTWRSGVNTLPGETRQTAVSTYINNTQSKVITSGKGFNRCAVRTGTNKHVGRVEWNGSGFSHPLVHQHALSCFSAHRGSLPSDGAGNSTTNRRPTVTNRRVQGMFRRRMACKVVAERRSAALAALRRAEELRRHRRRREADARKRYEQACRAEGKR